MPEEVALATTKRKFYKALDTFTTESQVSLVPSATATPTSTKRTLTSREALEEAQERATKRLRHSVSSAALPQQVPAIPSPASKTADPSGTPKKPANYSPWSHGTFLARLKTFSSASLWHSKPDAISEVEWAKRGWVCVDVNTVGCKGGCEKRVVVSMEPPKKTAQQPGADEDEVDTTEDDEAFEQALTERYKDEIINGHKPNCLWRLSGCKDDIYHLSVVRPAAWAPELKKRFQSTLALRTDIEDVKLRPAEKDETKVLPTARLLKDLPPDVVAETPTGASFFAAIPALEIALHGWRGYTEHKNAILQCDACFHRIGLWMYQPGYKPTWPLSDDDEDGEDATTIDLVEMHREHCPWRNADAQKSSGIFKGLNACQILPRVVSTYAKDYRRRSTERSGATPLIEPPSLDGAEDVEPPVHSKEEIMRQDKERESRLRKIKNLFSIKRKSKSVPSATIAAAKS